MTRYPVSSGKSGNSTLSLGGGITYQDLTLSRSGSDLILNIGSSDRIGSGRGASYARNRTGCPVVCASAAAHRRPLAKLSWPRLTLANRAFCPSRVWSF